MIFQYFCERVESREEAAGEESKKETSKEDAKEETSVDDLSEEAMVGKMPSKMLALSVGEEGSNDVLTGAEDNCETKWVGHQSTIGDDDYAGTEGIRDCPWKGKMSSSKRTCWDI